MNPSFIRHLHPMRLITPFCCLLVLASAPGQAQPVKSRPTVITCEMLCGELFNSIRAEPDKMVMRLEEALVIHESCAGDIVTTAMDAVNAEPGQVRKIVETALELAPRRASMITAAVQHYTSPAIVAAAEEPFEVRRAVVPEAAPPQLMAGEVVRRAEMPLQTQSIPIVEVRRAEPVAAQVQYSTPALQLSDVPRARPLK